MPLWLDAPTAELGKLILSLNVCVIIYFLVNFHQSSCLTSSLKGGRIVAIGAGDSAHWGISAHAKLSGVWLLLVKMLWLG